MGQGQLFFFHGGRDEGERDRTLIFCVMLSFEITKHCFVFSPPFSQCLLCNIMKLLSPVDGPGSPSLPVTANNHEKQPSTSVLGQDQVLSQPISQTSPDKRHAETAPDDGPPPPQRRSKNPRRETTRSCFTSLTKTCISIKLPTTKKPVFQIAL